MNCLFIRSIPLGPENQLSNKRAFPKKAVTFATYIHHQKKLKGNEKTIRT